VTLSSVPDIIKPATLAYTNASAASNKLLITSPSTNQTANPIATPTIKVYQPSTQVTLNFDLNTNFVGPQTLSNGNTTATHGYTWFVEYIPNSSIFGSFTAAQQLNFAVTLAFGGGTGVVIWDGGTPTWTNNYNVFQFYTVDGVNVKGRVWVQN